MHDHNLQEAPREVLRSSEKIKQNAEEGLVKAERDLIRVQ
jgi:hypothetical protein